MVRRRKKEGMEEEDEANERLAGTSCKDAQRMGTERQALILRPYNAKRLARPCRAEYERSMSEPTQKSIKNLSRDQEPWASTLVEGKEVTLVH